ncbi:MULTISPECIES: hypothetical protein [unclassified Ruegeria]|uniref:hypothetical protein n=1 Tax=unclassified Ruegeria TaxID=2625375 RepID=UPI0014924AE8|nr:MULTISPECIES: hypothetical protein [unclassified Ruegeria]NOC46499.1 hypothetical protein [Ruegeria sp. HKCCD7559]NOD85498.1 hypothetical protein [Ruegeria sp. HKCCD6119]
MERIWVGAAAGIALLAMSACEPDQAAVLQLDDNKIKVVGTGYSEKSSLESAISTANARCAQQGKEAFVLASDTGYQGVDKNAALIIDVLTAAAQNSGSAPGYYPSSSSSEDWQTTLEVRCGPQPR